MNPEHQKVVFKSEDEIIKFNPYHGRDGRFTSANGSVSFTYQSGTKQGKKSIEREKNRTSGAVLVSPAMRDKMTKAGVTNLGLSETKNKEEFSDALKRAKESNPHGSSVDEKTPDELKTMKTILSHDGMAGVAVKDDGDITAVFKNSNSKAKGAVTDLILTARENGGQKMDCYGEFLATQYEKCGYRVVARVEFNPEYCNDPKLLKERPNVYVLARTSKSTEQVVSEIQNKTTKRYTVDELKNSQEIKQYDKDGYDDALEYRNGLIDVVKSWGNKNMTIDRAKDELDKPVDGKLLDELAKKYKDNDDALEMIEFARDGKGSCGLRTYYSLVRYLEEWC